MIAVTVSVCLSVRSQVSKNHMSKLHRIVCTLTVAVAQFSSDNIAVRYILRFCEWHDVYTWRGFSRGML